MRKANIPLAIAAILILTGFVYLAMYSGAATQKLHLKTIKLQSTEQKLKSINIQYEKLDTQLKTESSNSQEKIDDLKQQQEKLQKEKQELEAKLQAKAIEKQRLAEAAEKAAQAATAAKVAQAAPVPQTSVPRPIGDKYTWMTAAGIPESDWPYVECVINGCQGVSAEGGWGGTQRWNTTGSGAYGLCQALPGSKMASAGPDWATNPVTQLRWCHGYAQAYGGWKAAWEFRRCVGRCYSTKVRAYVNKDHTWW